MIETVSFLRAAITGFRRMGAVLPSSPQLAKAMVDAIPPLEPAGVIVELGPGTGVFTRALHERYPAHRIVAVEFNHGLAERLQHRMPGVTVISGCASCLSDHLDELGVCAERVGVVVSGLPLLSLPRELGDRIFAGIAGALVPGRRYVQFTYSKRAWRRRSPPGFQLDRPRQVWLNLPPASVLPFTRTQQPRVFAA